MAGSVGTTTLTPETAEFLGRVREIVAQIEYRGAYRWDVGVDRANPDGRVFIQLEHYRQDATDNTRWGWGRGGKRYLSPWMTTTEIAHALFASALAYEEHEVREFFTYKGKRVFGPHLDVEALVEVADRLDIRP